jgi:RHS repeat-associated protein
MAKANPFRFSTKYQDDETDLLYYGYRYYSASTGRWVSEDPIGTRGGPNLYGFVANTATDRIDRLGLDYLPYPFPHNTDTSVYQQPQRGKRCGVCGPEVGTALLKTFESVERKFAQLQNVSERKTACSKLGLLGKWDVTFQEPPVGCASGDCKNTVAINGKCYSAWAVNYLLFGRISKLCSFSEAAMQSMVFGNKAVIKPIW